MKEGLIVLGAPFSGKNTVAERLSKQEGIPHIDAGQLVRDRAKIDNTIRDMTTKGLQLPPEISYKLVLDQFDKIIGNILLVNGFPRQRINAERFSESFSPWAVVVLDVALEEIFRRHDTASERKSRIDYGGRDILLLRLQAYFSEDTQEVQDYYSKLGLLVRIDANEEVEKVYDSVNRIYQENKR
jgi:adenylate kinase family enzyme